MKSNPTSKGRFLFSLLMLAAVVLSACGGAATTPAPTNTPEPPTATPEPVVTDYSGEAFVGPAWYWLGTQYNDDSKIEVANPAGYSLTFGADGNYSGQADCNFFAGTYSLVDGVLSLQPGPMTLAACPEGSLSDGYIQALGQVGTYLLQDGKLYLDLALDTGTMAFGPQPAPVAAAQPYANHPLTGPAWQWLRFEGSDGSVVEPEFPQRYVLQFLPDGGLRGQADCNSLGGTFVQQEFNLAIEAAELSKVACAEDSLAGQFIQTVTQSTTYTLEPNLMLMTTSNGVATFGALPLFELQPPAEGRPAAQAAGYLSLRSGPGIEFPVLGVIPAGAIAEALGRNADGAWLGINAPVVLGQGWVKAEEMVATGAENLPVSATPPLPPTATLVGPAEGDPQLAVLDTLYLRSGPGDNYPAYGVAPAGALGKLSGRSADGLYWLVQVDPAAVSTGLGWVSSALTRASNATELGVVEAPALPENALFPAPPAGAASAVLLTSAFLRDGANPSAAILGVAPAGATGEIVGRSQDNAWWQLRVPSTQAADGLGWIEAAYAFAFNAGNVPLAGGVVVEPTIAPTQPLVLATRPAGSTTSGGLLKIGTTTDTVNMRAGPGNQYDSYGVLATGTSGVIVATNPEGTWVAFSVPVSIAKDGKGWISALYVKVSQVNQATATARATAINPVGGNATPGPNATSQPPVTNACKIISKKPADGTVYKPNFEFDMRVEVQNTSNADWDVNAVDVKFISALGNAPVHTSPSTFDLPELVKAGANLVLFVDMQAPAQEGSYGETWALVQGGTTLCQWSFTFKVQKP